MKGITEEEEVILYHAVRTIKVTEEGKKIVIVKDLGLCNDCLHSECPDNPGHDEWKRFHEWIQSKKQQQGQEGYASLVPVVTKLRGNSEF